MEVRMKVMPLEAAMTYQFDYTLSLNLTSDIVVIGKVAPVPKLHTIKLYYIWSCKLCFPYRRCLPHSYQPTSLF